jgi:hypothetical protein
MGREARRVLLAGVPRRNPIRTPVDAWIENWTKLVGSGRAHDVEWLWHKGGGLGGPEVLISSGSMSFVAGGQGEAGMEDVQRSEAVKDSGVYGFVMGIRRETL